MDQRTEQGTILGLYYYPCGTELAEQFDDGWRYVLMPNKNSDETSYLQENQIQPLSPEELFSQIRAEIDFYQPSLLDISQINELIKTMCLAWASNKCEYPNHAESSYQKLVVDAVASGADELTAISAWMQQVQAVNTGAV